MWLPKKDMKKTSTDYEKILAWTGFEFMMTSAIPVQWSTNWIITNLGQFQWKIKTIPSSISTDDVGESGAFCFAREFSIDFGGREVHFLFFFYSVKYCICYLAASLLAMQHIGLTFLVENPKRSCRLINSCGSYWAVPGATVRKPFVNCLRVGSLLRRFISKCPLWHWLTR